MILPFNQLAPALGLKPGSPEEAFARWVHPKAERLVKDHVGYDPEQKPHVEFHPAYADPRAYPALVAGEGIGNPVDAIGLRHVPVRSIVTVNINEMAWTTSNPAGEWPAVTVLDPSGYRLDYNEDGLCLSGLLYNLGYSGTAGGFYWPGGLWPDTPRSVRVEYVGGWAPEELADEAGEFQLAVVQTVQKFYNELRANQAARGTAGTGPVMAEAADGQSFQWGAAVQNMGMVLALPPSVRDMLTRRVNYSRKL